MHDLAVLESHKGWVKDIEETQGVNLTYPIVAGTRVALCGGERAHLSLQTVIARLRSCTTCSTRLTSTRLVRPLCYVLHAVSCYLVSGLPLTVRSVFIVDPNKKIRLIITYPARCFPFV